jgi:ABC-type taurine transport system substrate-binding protein
VATPTPLPAAKPAEAGQMDLNFGNTISTTTAIARGFKLQIVAPASSARDAPPDSATLVVAKGSAIKSPKDLEGRKVAVDSIRTDEAGARKLIAEYAKLDPSIAEGMAINAFRPTVNPDQWQKTIELMVKFKVIDQPIQIREFIHEFALNPPQIGRR